MRSPHARRRAVALAAPALVAVLGALAVLGVPGSPASAAAGARRAGGDATAVRGSGRRGIVVVQVNGLLDPPNAALVTKSLRDAAREHVSLVVFQLDGSGAVDVHVDSLVQAIARSPVPVAVWVGPSGGRARGASALLALAASYTSVAPGAHIGPVVPVDFGRPHELPVPAAAREVAALERRPRPGAGDAGAVVRRRLSAKDALAAKLIDGNEPTLGQFIVAMNGRVLHTAAGDVRMATSVVVGTGKDRRVQTDPDVRFRKLDLSQQLAHTLGTPWVAYFLFVAGMALIVFEFFTAGVGIAGAVGALSLLGGCFGFSHLPVAPWALALLIVGVVGLAIDLQAGALGPWSFIGGAALVAGSVFLYDGAGALDPAWWIIVLVCAGTIVFVVYGMTAMVRSRFSTPTIGREDLVGELGVAEVGVDPDGVVRVRDALWRARTNRATPIGPGDTVRVVAVEGIVLEVEPESGGARDYRDRSGRH